MKWFVRGPPFEACTCISPDFKRGLALFVERSRGSGFEGSERRSVRVTALPIDETSEQAAWIRLWTRFADPYRAYQGNVKHFQVGREAGVQRWSRYPEACRAWSIYHVRHMGPMGDVRRTDSTVSMLRDVALSMCTAG